MGWDRPYDPYTNGAGYTYTDASGRPLGRFTGNAWVHNNTLTTDMMRELVGNDSGPYGFSPQTIGWNNFTDQSYQNDLSMKTRDNDSALGALMGSGYAKVLSLPFMVGGIQNGLSSMFNEGGPLEYTASGEPAVSPDAWTNEMNDYLKTSTVDDTMGDDIFDLGMDWYMPDEAASTATDGWWNYDGPGGDMSGASSGMSIRDIASRVWSATRDMSQVMSVLRSFGVGGNGSDATGSYSFPWGSAIGGGLEYLGQRERLDALREIERANQARWEATRATDESRYQTALQRQDRFYNDDTARYDAAVATQNPFSTGDRQGFVDRYKDLTTNPQAGFLRQFAGPLNDVGEMAGRSSAAAGYNGTSRGYLNVGNTMQNTALKDFYMPAVDDAWRAASWAPTQVSRPGQQTTINGNQTTNYATNPGTATALSGATMGPSGALGTMFENIQRGNQPSLADQILKGTPQNQSMSDWLFA